MEKDEQVSSLVEAWRVKRANHKSAVPRRFAIGNGTDLLSRTVDRRSEAAEVSTTRREKNPL